MGPSGVCREGAGPLAEGTGLRGSLLSPHTRHCSHLQHSGQLPLPRTAPAPAAHRPPAQAHPLRDTPGKLRYGLFLRLPDSVGTLPYSLLTAGKNFCTGLFSLNIYTYIYICVCVCIRICTSIYTDIHTHTHPGSNI